MAKMAVCKPSNAGSTKDMAKKSVRTMVTAKIKAPPGETKFERTSFNGSSICLPT